MNLKNLLSRGVVVLVNAASKMQGMQVKLLANEVKDGMEHFEAYGFTSNPLPGAEVLAAFFGGDRSHGVIFCAGDRRFRLQSLKPGEVAIYTDEGDKIHFKRNRVIEVETVTFKVKATEAVEFDTPEIRTTGMIVSQGDQVAGGISQMHHEHDKVMFGDSVSGQPVAAAP